MHTCIICGGKMKMLFTGMYCPKDCDRKTESVAESQDYDFVNDAGSYRYKFLNSGDLVPNWASWRSWSRVENKPIEITFLKKKDTNTKAWFELPLDEPPQSVLIAGKRAIFEDVQGTWQVLVRGPV